MSCQVYCTKSFVVSDTTDAGNNACLFPDSIPHRPRKRGTMGRIARFKNGANLPEPCFPVAVIFSRTVLASAVLPTIFHGHTGSKGSGRTAQIDERKHSVSESLISQQWREQGYLVLRQVWPKDRIAAIYETCEAVYTQWKAESSRENQPGGFAYVPRGWVLLHLNHPQYHVGRPDRRRLVLEAIADALIQDTLETLFRNDPVFMQANYCVDPADEGWAGVWHRDCQFFAKGDEAVVARSIAEEADPPRELHVHIPLIPTEATHVVPGSHVRYDTDAERSVRLNDPTACMPGAIRLSLEPGDLAFFHVNTLHRGSYDLGIPRRTIAISYGRRDFPRPPTVEWMRTLRGYVATYQPWFSQTGYLDGLNAREKAFFDRFADVYGPYWGPELLIPEIGAERHAYYAKASEGVREV